VRPVFQHQPRPCLFKFAALDGTAHRVEVGVKISFIRRTLDWHGVDVVKEVT
jgi:hypothetical protein